MLIHDNIQKQVPFNIYLKFLLQQISVSKPLGHPVLSVFLNIQFLSSFLSLIIF